jgi:hypothetical protein
MRIESNVISAAKRTRKKPNKSLLEIVVQRIKSGTDSGAVVLDAALAPRHAIHLAGDLC